jgi:hypothetical protein
MEPHDEASSAEAASLPSDKVEQSADPRRMINNHSTEALKVNSEIESLLVSLADGWDRENGRRGEQQGDTDTVEQLSPRLLHLSRRHTRPRSA